MTERPMFERLWALEDISISRATSDGRTVEAYAAIFNTPAEIHDRHGHYIEEIDDKAFNRQLGLGIERVGVYYNHGMTIHGTPSDMHSVPIGRPMQIKADARGLLTVTRYNDGAAADSILDAIRNSAIRGYSFRGPIFRSQPEGRIRPGRGGALPTVRRTELGLLEYGPTPSPAYADAAILAVRSDKVLAALTEAQQYIESFVASTPAWDQEPQTATPKTGPGAEDQHANALRSAHLRLRSELRSRGVCNENGKEAV